MLRSSQAVLKGVGHAIRQRMMVTASGCVCRKHNMTDRDDVSVENATLCSPNEDAGRLNKALRYVFERILNDSSPKSSTHALEKDSENVHATLCSVGWSACPTPKGVVPGRVKGCWACAPPAHDDHRIRVCLSKTQHDRSR